MNEDIPIMCDDGLIDYWCECTACNEYWHWAANRNTFAEIGRIEPTIGDIDSIVFEEDKFDKIKI